MVSTWTPEECLGPRRELQSPATPPTPTFPSRLVPTSTSSPAPSLALPLPLALSSAPPPPPSYIETHPWPVARLKASTVDVNPAASRSRLCGLHALPALVASHVLLTPPPCLRHLRIILSSDLLTQGKLAAILDRGDIDSPACQCTAGVCGPPVAISCCTFLLM